MIRAHTGGPRTDDDLEVKNQYLFRVLECSRKPDSYHCSCRCQQQPFSPSCGLKPSPTEAAVTLPISLCGTSCSLLSGSYCHFQAHFPLVPNLALDGPSILYTWNFLNIPCCALSLCRCCSLCLESFPISLWHLASAYLILKPQLEPSFPPHPSRPMHLSDGCLLNEQVDEEAHGRPWRDKQCGRCCSPCTKILENFQSQLPWVNTKINLSF